MVGTGLEAMAHFSVVLGLMVPVWDFYSELQLLGKLPPWVQGGSGVGVMC